MNPTSDVTNYGQMTDDERRKKALRGLLDEHNQQFTENMVSPRRPAETKRVKVSRPQSMSPRQIAAMLSLQGGAY